MVKDEAFSGCQEISRRPVFYIRIHEKIHMNTKYSLPKDIYAKSYGGFMLIISPSSGNWIVLNSQQQIDILKSLIDGLTLSEIHERFSSQEIAEVIAQIEGRKFMQADDEAESEDASTLRLYLTSKCNLRCTHCFMYASEALDDELTTGEIFGLIEGCRNYGCVKVILTGGEVLTRNDFGDILKFADSLGMYVQVLTNGTLWSEENVHELSGYIDEVQISIDGYDEASNAEIRGRNAFAQAMNALDMFTSEDNILTVAVITPLYEGLENHRTEYRDFMKALTERYMNKNFLALIQSELIDGRNLKADFERNMLMSQTVKEIHEEIYENSELTAFIMNHRDRRVFRNCGYGNITVSSTGDVYFCGRIHDVRKYANLRDTSFDEIMHMRRLVRKFTGADYVMPYRECELKYICGGGCRVKNFPDAVRSDIENFGNVFFRRNIECTAEDKERLYRLMIESNSFLMMR